MLMDERTMIYRGKLLLCDIAELAQRNHLPNKGIGFNRRA